MSESQREGERTGDLHTKNREFSIFVRTMEVKKYIHSERYYTSAMYLFFIINFLI